MIIKINKDGKNVANLEIAIDDYDNYYLVDKNNIKNVYIDMAQGKNGFTECLDIDL